MMQKDHLDIQELAAQLRQFALSCLRRLEATLLVDGLLPPVVRGHRVMQARLDQRAHMGGSSAENAPHYATFLATLHALECLREDGDLEARILRTLKPFFGQHLIPFPHRAVLKAFAAYGPLSESALWDRLSAVEKQAARATLFDVSHYYDVNRRQLHALPPNYLWVTADNALTAWRLAEEDAADMRPVFDAALEDLLTILDETTWLDDSPPRVVIDQYAWEAVAAAVDLCQRDGRTDALERLLPIAQRYMHLLRSLVRRDGYGICWGRSLGVISYTTTIAFMTTVGRALYQHGYSTHRQWTADLDASADAIRELTTNWFDADGLITMHKFGRETYAYRRAHRLVGTTFDTLTKLLLASARLADVVPPRDLPSEEASPSSMRFTTFQTPKAATRDRAYGVWVARTPAWHVCLPVVGSNHQYEPLVSSNYLPVPHVPFVLDAPVQQSTPYGTQFVELDDGSVWAAAEGCDSYLTTPDGLELCWERLVNIATLELRADIGSLRMQYRLIGPRFVWTQSFTGKTAAIAWRYGLLGIALERMQTVGDRHHRFTGRGQAVSLKIEGDVRKVAVEDVRDLPSGKGYLGAIPWAVTMHLPATGGTHRVILTREEPLADELPDHA